MLMATPAPVELDVVPDSVRGRGGVRLLIGRTRRGSAPLRVAEGGGGGIRFPCAEEVCEGVLINTGGGLTGDGRMSVDAVIGADAAAILTTQAAEKNYRSDGLDAEAAVDLTLEAGSCLAWLPQEQILFDAARLRRRSRFTLPPTCPSPWPRA